MSPAGSNHPDAEKLAAARAGDRKALDDLLRRHEKRIYRFGLRMCGDEEAAKEVLQRTMLQAFEQVGTFRGDARLSTWLYAIARSFCSREHRRTRSAPLHDVDLDAPGDVQLPPSSEPHPEEIVARTELAELMSAALHALPATYREVVVLRDVEGLPAEDAAKVVGLGVPALKSRLHRGRQMLRAHLAALLREEGRTVGGAQACPELASQLTEISEHPLDQAACARIERHIADCEPCRDTLGELRATASLCRALPGGQVPEPVRRAVRVALLDALSIR